MTQSTETEYQQALRLNVVFLCEDCFRVVVSPDLDRCQSCESTRRVAVVRPGGVRHCRVCGCHDERACSRSATDRCSWAERDLCSFCAERIAAGQPVEAEAVVRVPADFGEDAG